MQKLTDTKMLRCLAIAMLSAQLSASCTESEGSKRDLHERSASTLILDVGEEEDRVVVYIANVSSDNIKVNRMFRPYGAKPELTFFIDGNQAKYSSAAHAIVMPDDISDPSVMLAPDQLIGTAIRKSDLRNLFGIEAESCHEVSVAYRNPLNLDGVYSGRINSNTVRICF